MGSAVCVDDYAVTAAGNLSDKLGGMNTCDRHSARENVRQTYMNTCTHSHTCPGTLPDTSAPKLMHTDV